MTDMKAKQQSKTIPQDSRERCGSQSTVTQTGEKKQRNGSEFPLLFSVSPRDFPTGGSFERLWWVSIPRAAR
jgi:hypothetical protein